MHVLFILGCVILRSGFGAVQLPGPGSTKQVFLKGLLGVDGVAADLGGQLQQL